MYRAANENFESKDLWKPASQAGHLDKLATLVETDSLADKMIVWRTILGLIVASKWPAPQSACRFSNDRRQGLVINANKFREARSYAKNPPPRFHKLGDVDGRRYESAADLPRVTRGRRLHRCDERKVRSCTLRIILWQLFVAVEILLLPSRWRS